VIVYGADVMDRIFLGSQITMLSADCYSVGYSAREPVGPGFGPRLVRGQVIPRLQNTRRLSDTVAHLGLRPRRVGQIGSCRILLWSGLVVNRRGGCRTPYLADVC
jgi:hypothetical protein